MIPPTFIFDETQEVIAARANRDRIATGLARFVAIGAGMAVFYVGLTEVLMARFADMPAAPFSTFVFAALLVPVYFLSHNFAFFSEAAHADALPRYAAVQLAFLLLATGFSFVAHGVVGMPHLGTGLLVFFLTAGVNFSILRRWAFASR